jgi:DNA repair protein RecO (recombination protein O)
VPLYQSDAFVLRTYKLGETDQIVVFFTRDFGKVRAVARRSHSSRRYTAGYYQPLTLLRTILFAKPSQTLYRINTVDIVQAFRPLREDFEYLRCGLYLTELIDISTGEREPVPELFTLLHLTLEQLPQAAHTTILLRLFELRLLTTIGYAPQLEYCAYCARDMQPHEALFSPQFGGLVCTACSTEVRQTFPVQRASVEFLRQAIASDTSNWLSWRLEATVQQDLERLLHAHLTARLGRELKSYAFLHL